PFRALPLCAIFFFLIVAHLYTIHVLLSHNLEPTSLLFIYVTIFSYFHIFTIYNFVNCNKMIYLFIFLPYCSTYCSRTKYYLSILPAEHKYEKLLCVKTVTTMKLFIIYETQKKYIM